MLVINPVEQKENLFRRYSRSPPRKQDIQAISGQQDISCRAHRSDSSTAAVGLRGSKPCSSFQQFLFHFTRLKRREQEPESKNGNRASNVKSLHLLSSRVAHEIPAFKIKETSEVEELQKKLFAGTLGKNYPSIGLCFFFTGENFLSWF